jgi:hypothetical protein
MIKILRVALTGLCLLVNGVTLRAQVLNENFWVPNGTVRGIARDRNTIYVGGNFSQVGPKIGTGIVVNRQDGQPTGNLKSLVNRRVDAAVPDGSGGWYIGGQFTQAGGAEHQLLAHVRADGSVDPAFRFDFGTTNPIEISLMHCKQPVVRGRRFYRSKWGKQEEPRRD